MVIQKNIRNPLEQCQDSLNLKHLFPLLGNDTFLHLMMGLQIFLAIK